MGRLTTHVLDTARGVPAAGLVIELYRLDLDRHKLLATQTNDDGRTDAPLLDSPAFRTGSYEIIFFAGNYLRDQGLADGHPLFLDHVPVRFGIAEDRHYHVPLLLSPFGYSTYRGS